LTDNHLHPLELTLLRWLALRPESSDTECIAGTGLDEGSYRRAAQWLLARGYAVIADTKVDVKVELGPKGNFYMATGITPEKSLFEKVRNGYTALRDIQQNSDPFNNAQMGSAMGTAFKENILGGNPDNLLINDPSGGVFNEAWIRVYEPINKNIEVNMYDLPERLQGYIESKAPKRGKSDAEFILVEQKENILAITDEGRKALASAGDGNATGALTREILASGEWRNAAFRRYRVDIPPARILTGRLHPYGSFLDGVRAKFVSMGFQEMSGPLAESEFWNNDALFMPQFHAARDIHDAYYLEEDSRVDPPDPALIERVAGVHRNGGDTGGRGWGYDFSISKTMKAVLRSQGTALSARTLASGPEVPGKYFGIAKCFRYDQVDATHLPDFYQVEGIVLGEDINFRHLLGLLKLFAEEIAGAESYRYVPAYFPFTEPSVELHVKHSVLGWFEMGGAGLFRQEVTLPLGVRAPVIAWGLGLDRMALLAMGLSDIRDLVTPDLARLRQMSVKPDWLPGRKA
jgi:phenylalanyl-tRNA synthetase alpha chain